MSRQIPVDLARGAVPLGIVVVATFAAMASIGRPSRVRATEIAATSTLTPSASQATAVTTSAVSPGVGGAGRRVLAVLRHVRRTLRESRYQPRTHVNVGQGVYRWDCSGMTAWVLSKSAPRALRSLGKVRPVARDFARVIAAAPTSGGRTWRRIERVADTLPGDVFAWECQPPPEGVGRMLLAARGDRGAIVRRRRPGARRRIITGHVGFVVEVPRRVEGGWLVRIADSTSVPHGDDTRTDTDVTGFGMGSILILENELGVPEAVGWAGLGSAWVRRVPFVIGRVLR